MSRDERVTVKVLFFGATADSVGVREADADLEGGLTARDAFSSLLNMFPALSVKHDPEALLFSINQSYATGKEIIKEGDELAVFTAVSGG